MKRIPGIRPAPHAGSTKRSIERDIDDEMDFHLRARIDDLMRQGCDSDAAERLARAEYGDTDAARRELAAIDRRVARKLGWREWLTGFNQDLRFAARALRARPAFAATVLLTIALGVGANAAIFSVVDAVLLRPLPFAQPDRLVHFWEAYEGKVENRSEASYPDYLDLRARQRSLDALGGYHGGSILIGGDQPATVRGGRATANFFDVLGVRPALGRLFHDGDDDVGAEPVVVLTDGLWKRRFGGDSTIVGRRITIDGAAATVVGVLPEAFKFSRVGAEVWAPINRSRGMREQRGSHWLNVVARLKPGVSLEQASSDITRIMTELRAEYPQTNAGRRGALVPLRQELVGSVRPILILLYGAVVVVLLIACVNVANLLLMRGADRQRELALRVALGADKSRIIRQLLTESTLLGLLGGALGIVAALVGVRALVALVPAAQARGISGLADAAVDGRIVGYTLALSLVAGLAFGVVPALRASRPSLTEDLKSGTRGSTGGSARLRDLLVTGEIALTVVLLSGALLFGRSLLRLLAIDPGFRPAQVVTATVVLPATSYADGARRSGFYERLLTTLRATPGVQDVGMVSRLPLDFGNSLGFVIVGQPPVNPAQRPSASYRQTGADYFRTMGIPTLRGRVFDASDTRDAPLTGVINRALATAYFGAREPIGQRLVVGSDTLTIVGMVGDVPIGNIDDRIPPTLYLAYVRVPETVLMSVVMRTTLPAAALGASVRRVAASIDPEVAVMPAMAMDDLVLQSPSVFLRRFPLFLVGAFAATALALAIVGIYGVVSYSVAQRTRELGIRTALGARPEALRSLVIRHGLGMAAVGVVVGGLAARLAGRFAAKLLYGVTPTDPLVHTVVALVLATAAVVATLVPARRASRVDPAVALRAE